MTWYAPVVLMSWFHQVRLLNCPHESSLRPVTQSTMNQMEIAHFCSGFETSFAPCWDPIARHISNHE